MPNPTELAWAAGFFDGEGCVIVELSKNDKCRHGYRTVLHAQVSQTSLPCLELFLEWFGGKIVTSRDRTPNGRRWSVQHRWGIKNEGAIDFLKQIRPYLVVKAEQVDVALKYPLKRIDGVKYGNLSNPIPDHVMQARLDTRKMLQDIRASMKEPAYPPGTSHAE